MRKRKRPPCGCTNHLGGPKFPYPSQQAAILDGIRRLKHTGAVTAYKCPRSNRWHLTTTKGRKNVGR